MIESASTPRLPRLFYGRRRPLLALLIANGLAQAALAAGTAFAVHAGFNRLLGAGGHASTPDALAIGALLVVMAVAFAALRGRERADAERLGQRYVHSVRLTLFRRLLTLSPRALERRSQGAVVLRFVGDLSALRQWVSLGLARLVVTGVVVAGTLLALAAVDRVLAGIVTAVLAAGAVASALQGARLRDAARAARRDRSRLAANVTEKVGAISVVQAFDQGERERRLVSSQSRALREAMVERARVAGRLRALSEGTGSLASTGALLAGALEVQAGRASVGTVVAAMMIVGLLVPRLSDLARVQEYWHNSRVALDRIHDFLGSPAPLQQMPDAPALEARSGRVELRDVGLDGAVHGVSAVAEPGTVVAIVGRNGAGKSTLLALVARLLDPDRGRVLIDGQDLARTDASSVRRAIGMAGPDLPLLRGSVRRNLTYRRRDASEEEIAEVLELCELGDLLERLPEGIETRVRDAGRGLSAGERQRIALARALLGDPPLLLLDEVESNLDPAARRVVRHAIDGRRGRSTVLVATHRPDLVAAADVVWELDGGRLKQVVPPRQWLADRGLVELRAGVLTGATRGEDHDDAPIDGLVPQPLAPGRAQ